MKDKIKNLIKNGNIQKAIEELERYSIEFNKDIEEEVLLISQRFFSLKTKNRKGIVSSDELNVEMNKIADSVVSILNNNHNSIQRKLNYQLPIVFLFLFLILIVIGIAYPQMSDSNKLKNSKDALAEIDDFKAENMLSELNHVKSNIDTMILENPKRDSNISQKAIEFKIVVENVKEEFEDLTTKRKKALESDNLVLHQEITRQINSIEHKYEDEKILTDSIIQKYIELNQAIGEFKLCLWRMRNMCPNCCGKGRENAANEKKLLEVDFNLKEQEVEPDTIVRIHTGFEYKNGGKMKTFYEYHSFKDFENKN